jgi:hypothetical protein
LRAVEQQHFLLLDLLPQFSISPQEDNVLLSATPREQKPVVNSNSNKFLSLQFYPPFLTMLSIIIGRSHRLEISSSSSMKVAVLQVSGGAVPSPPLTNQLPMFSTSKNSKSALPPPIIDLTPMESMIHSLEAVIRNATNEIDLAHSTLHCYRARLASVGIFAAHKEEGPKRNIKINFENDKQSESKDSFPPNMYVGNNNGNNAALVVQRYVSENIPL